MRWKKKPTEHEQVRRRFLLVPKTIEGETRWLEWARWRESFSCDDPDCSCDYADCRWYPVEWL